MTDTTADLRISFEWQPGERVTTAELRSTWARLEIWVGNECVTYVEDVESDSVRRSLFVSLYPLAEWVAYNWWFLRGDVRPAVLSPRHWSTQSRRNGNALWRYRHNLRGIGEGFAWPDLALIPEGEYTTVSWTADREPPVARRVRFIREGAARVRTIGLGRQLSNLVDAVLTRLEESGVHETALAKEWAGVRTADEAEQDFCMAAARLGLDPYSEAQDVQDLIVTAAGELEPILFEDFLDAVDPGRIESGLRWVAASKRRLGAVTRQSSRPIADLKTPSLVEGAGYGMMPWLKGYQHARNVREALNLLPQDRFPIGDLLVVEEGDSDDEGLQGLGGMSDIGAPALVTGRPMDEESRVFASARALWRFLYSTESRFLLTRAHTDRQMTERAFAAEVLAPASGVSALLGAEKESVSEHDVRRVSAHFRVGYLVVEHQVENQLDTAVQLA